MKQLTLFLLILLTFGHYSLAYNPFSYLSVKIDNAQTQSNHLPKVNGSESLPSDLQICSPNNKIALIKSPHNLIVCLHKYMSTSSSTKKTMKTFAVHITHSVLTPIVNTLKQFDTKYHQEPYPSSTKTTDEAIPTKTRQHTYNIAPDKVVTKKLSYSLLICKSEYISLDYPVKKAIRISPVNNTNTILNTTVVFSKHLGLKLIDLQSYVLNTIIMPTVDILDQQLLTIAVNLNGPTKLAIDNAEHKLRLLNNKVKNFINHHQFIAEKVDRIYINIVIPVTYKYQSICRMVKPIEWKIINCMDTVTTINEKIVHQLENIYHSPSLEWYLFLNKVDKKWADFCTLFDNNSYICRLHHELFSKNRQLPEKLDFQTDNVIQDMVLTKYHSQFYKQMMYYHFSSLDAEQRSQVVQTKNDFIKWIEDGESLWHEFVNEFQHDWYLLMKVIYQDFEEITRHTFSSPIIAINNNCNSKSEKELIISTSKPTTTRQYYKPKENKSNIKNYHYYQLKSWQHDLLELSDLLYKSSECISLHPRNSNILSPTFSPNVNYNYNNSKNIKPTALLLKALSSSKNNKINTQRGVFKYLSKRNLLFKKHPTQEIVGLMTKLQKEKYKQFLKVDKYLQRSLYKTMPPKSNQTMHPFYMRLRDGVSAKNKNTFNHYTNQLLYSWNSIISNTLDIMNDMIDEIDWLKRKNPSIVTMNQNQEQNDHIIKALHLTWINAKKKLVNNNLNAIKYWNTTFMDIDTEIQETWDEMRTVVNSTHGSLFQYFDLEA
ncbi:unnamed protein product [Cunninghamella blakesleeana]